MLKRLLIHWFARIFELNFIVIQNDAVFMACDERALNCAVRDYIEMLDMDQKDITILEEEGE